LTRAAQDDFLQRIATYQQRYQSMGEVEEHMLPPLRYIKVFNVGAKVTLFNCHGYLPGQIGAPYGCAPATHRMAQECTWQIRTSRREESG
jgi:hypothetical protein